MKKFMFMVCAMCTMLFACGTKSTECTESTECADSTVVEEVAGAAEEEAVADSTVEAPTEEATEAVAE